MDEINYFEVSVWKEKGRYIVLSRYSPDGVWARDAFANGTYQTYEEAEKQAQIAYNEVERILITEPPEMVKVWPAISKRPIKPYKPPEGYEVVKNPSDPQEFLVFWNAGTLELLEEKKRQMQQGVSSYPYGEYPNHFPMHYESGVIIKKEPKCLDPEVQNITPQSA